MTSAVRWAAASIVTTLAASASAQGVGELPPAAADHGWASAGIGIALGPAVSEVAVTHVATDVRGGVRLAEHLSVTLDATYALTSFTLGSGDTEVIGRFGNPFIGAHWAWRSGPRGLVRLGAGVAPPLVTVPGDLTANAAADLGDAVAVAARGMQAPWLWSDNAIPVVLLLSLHRSVSETLTIGTDLQPALVASVNRRDSRVALDASAFASLQVGRLVPDVRLHTYAQSEPIEDGDFSQSSATFGTTYEATGWWLRGAGTINLDGPYGFGSRIGTRSGFALSTGARF